MERECPYLYKQVINNDHDSCDQSAKESLKAYSRLISAAPELLEACKEAILQIEYLHSKFKETGSGISVLLKLQIALAKAEGR